MTDLDQRVRRGIGQLLDLAPSLDDESTHQSDAFPVTHRRAPVLVGAALVAVIGVSGVAYLARNNSPAQKASQGTVSTAAIPAVDHGPAFVGAIAPPLLVMPADRWTLTYIDDSTIRDDLFVAVDAVAGFAGGSFVVLPDYQGVTGEDPRTIPGVEDLADDGINGTITGTNGFRQVDWQLGDRMLTAQTRAISDADAIAIVKSMTISATGTLEASVPDQMVILEPQEYADLDRYVSYTWTSDDGTRSIDATLQGGKAIGGAVPGQTMYPPTTLGDRTVYIDAPNRVTWLDGFWQWTVGGIGYDSLTDFLADAALVTAGSRAEWDAQVAGHAVTAEERPALVAEILADIPLPDGFDVAVIGSEDVAQTRYQLIARVTSAVWCAWGARWDAALNAGDTASAATAAAALTSSRQWNSLAETIADGDWANAIWDYSQRVSNGDRAVWAEAQSGLGCI